jgi:hypothetical protein
MELENVFKFFDKEEPLLIYTATLREDDDNYLISWSAEKEEEFYGSGNEKVTGTRSTVYAKDIVETFVRIGQWIVVGAGEA